ncbi:MAG: hypothetical protein AAGF25_06580 [Pseudomonadota bacterium]
MSDHEIKKALDALEAGEYKLGPEWEIAHNIAQAHEGKREFDHIHALVHRIEGDSFNAQYWYRRAGVEPFDGTPLEELAAMKTELLT